jgi:hypothetical protein
LDLFGPFILVIWPWGKNRGYVFVIISLILIYKIVMQRYNFERVNPFYRKLQYGLRAFLVVAILRMALLYLKDDFVFGTVDLIHAFAAVLIMYFF